MPDQQFPLPIAAYGDNLVLHLGEKLAGRAGFEPLAVWCSLIFLCAVLHTFFSAKFIEMAQRLEAQDAPRAKFRILVLHLLGELEVVFALWALPLLALVGWARGWGSVFDYLVTKVSFVEPCFVIVVMLIAGTRPILFGASRLLAQAARLGGSSPAAWWFSILTVAPLLGSMITEPAAMTIGALLLSKQFYRHQPSMRLSYISLGLLFVNVSIGGTLTHFAAPPVLMVARLWEWDTLYMLEHFGWISVTSICLSNTLGWFVNRREFVELGRREASKEVGETTSSLSAMVPLWIMAVHLGFLMWTVINAHHVGPLLVGLAAFMGFLTATNKYQDPFSPRGPILVGIFLAGLVIHGGFQAWWIEPVLSQLGKNALFAAAIVLTAFNDNAAITYLATFVPGLSEGMRYAVVAGAVTGGGLTVIANAPNPAGVALLGRHFPGGISPLRLLLGALVPTLIASILFWVGMP